MVGQNAVGNASLVKQVVDAGKPAGATTPAPTTSSFRTGRPRAIVDQVVGAQSTLSTAAGDAPVQWFRAPGGNWSAEVATLSAQHGMQPLSWNVDPQDWERPGAAAIVAAVQQQLRQQAPDGPIVLLTTAAARATRRSPRWNS